jgi:hypothetical protein
MKLHVLFLFCLSSVSLQAADSPSLVFGVFGRPQDKPFLVKTAQDKGLTAYYLNEKSVLDESSQTIKNVLTLKDGELIELPEAPMPQVVFDFGFYAKASQEKKNQALTLKQKLKSAGVHFLMEESWVRLLRNKMLFSIVMGKNDLPHPETREGKKANISALLDQGKQVYLKPILGAQGYGILIVTPEPKMYRLKYKIKKEEKWRTREFLFPNKKELFKGIAQAKKELHMEDKRYLAQEGYLFAEAESKQTYYRVNTQRDGADELVVSGSVAKVGGNLAQGGLAHTVFEVLENLFEPEKIHSIEKAVEAMALATHRAIEKEVGSSICELGMDLGVTKDGQVVIIEANNKPGALFYDSLKEVQTRWPEERRNKAFDAEKKRDSILVDYIKGPIFHGLSH